MLNCLCIRHYTREKLSCSLFLSAHKEQCDSVLKKLIFVTYIVELTSCIIIYISDYEPMKITKKPIHEFDASHCTCSEIEYLILQFAQWRHIDLVQNYGIVEANIIT